MIRVPPLFLPASDQPYSPYADQITVATLPGVHAQLETMELPLPVDTVKYLGVMFLCFPLGLVHAFLPAGAVRHLMNLITGVVLAQFVFGVQWVQPLAASTLVYATLVVTRSPVLVFVVMMAYMLLSHLHRLHTDYMGWSLDVTGPLMILTIKASSLGFNYRDGTADKASLQEKLKTGSAGAKRLASERLRSSISRLPNPLEFYAYVFCPTTFFAGPAFDFKHYLDGVNRPAAEAAKLPSRALRIVATAVFGVVFLALTGVGQGTFPFLTGTAPDVSVNPWITGQPDVWHVYGTALVCLFFVRVRYYFAWLLSESTALAFGFGFNPETKQWTTACNVDVVGFELASNLSLGSHAWNKHTQTWLERYVYKRCPRVSIVPMVATYLVSATWHGFYPGYYFMFLSVPLFQTLSKKFTADVRPLTVTKDKDGKEKAKWWKLPLYDVPGVIITHCTLNYAASAFVALGGSQATEVWTAYKFSAHIVYAALYVPVYLLFPSRRAPRATSTKKKTS